MPRDINPSIPEGLEEITIKAMQKDASKRYQSAAEMLLDIDEFKRNPSIHFEYKYFKDETPTRFVEAITKVKGEPSCSGRAGSGGRGGGRGAQRSSRPADPHGDRGGVCAGGLDFCGDRALPVVLPGRKSRGRGHHPDF